MASTSSTPTRKFRGRDVSAKFQTLAEELGKMDVWTRLHYVYPYPHVDSVIPLMAEGKILPYLDIPFQHASPTVLKAMRRPANQVKTLDRIKSWRAMAPDLTIRSNFIVGFPGETDEDFEFLLDWLEEAEIDRIGCFEYEPVTGAPANELEGIVPDEVKRERYERLMEVAQDISAACAGPRRSAAPSTCWSTTWSPRRAAPSAAASGTRRKSTARSSSTKPTASSRATWCR